MSQLRVNLKFTLLHHLRVLVQKQRLGFIGKKVFIDKGVEFLRFPRNITVKNHAVIKEGAKICSCNKDAIIEIGERLLSMITLVLTKIKNCDVIFMHVKSQIFVQRTIQ